MKRTALGLAGALLLTSCASTPNMTFAPKSELAPTGKLRIGINYGNFLLTRRPPAGGEPGGIAPDLGRELARRLGVAYEFVTFDAAGKLADAVKSGVWDIAFIGNEPQRAAEIDFSPAYLEIEAGYLVPAGSPIRSMADIDREGVRVAVAQKSAYDLYLSRTLKHAKLVRAEGIDNSYNVFVEQKLEALAGLKPRLITDAQTLPGSRVLEGRFSTVQQSIGTPKGREAGRKFLTDFVDEAKATGLIAKTIDQNGIRGVSVAQ
jgi:polar amino acid transport system substrate-binding protein